MRKDAIDASALCLYRKPEAAQPERPLFMEAPMSEAPDEVRGMDGLVPGIPCIWLCCRPGPNMFATSMAVPA